MSKMNLIRRIVLVITFSCIYIALLFLMSGWLRSRLVFFVGLIAPSIIGAIWSLTDKWKERAARLASLSEEQKATHHALEELEFYAGTPGISDDYLDSLLPEDRS